MSDIDIDIDVTDNADRQRFEARRGGELVGWIDYTTAGERLVLTHAETVHAFRGQGVGGATTRAVLDLVRAREETPQVLPACGFVAHWIHEHPDYQDLLPH